MDEPTASVDNARPTLLLVDDQQSIRYMLSAGLKAHGFEVFTAASGEKALALCEGYAGPLDLLLTDIGLTPHELWQESAAHESLPHGVAVAHRALELRPSLKVILFTGHSDGHLKRLGLCLDGFVLLRKPCPLNTLVTTLRTLLSDTPSSPVSEPKST
jgi:two-component system OmpR family response regulator